MRGLMSLDKFKSDSFSIRQIHRNHKDRIPKAIEEMINNYLEPLYFYIREKDSNWHLFKGERNVDSLKFNMLELFEIYSKASF